jgi:hypothetical protein
MRDRFAAWLQVLDGPPDPDRRAQQRARLAALRERVSARDPHKLIGLDVPRTRPELPFTKTAASRELLRWMLELLCEERGSEEAYIQGMNDLAMFVLMVRLAAHFGDLEFTGGPLLLEEGIFEEVLEEAYLLFERVVGLFEEVLPFEQAHQMLFMTTVETILLRMDQAYALQLK